MEFRQSNKNSNSVKVTAKGTSEKHVQVNNSKAKPSNLSLKSNVKSVGVKKSVAATHSKQVSNAKKSQVQSSSKKVSSNIKISSNNIKNTQKKPKKRKKIDFRYSFYMIATSFVLAGIFFLCSFFLLLKTDKNRTQLQSTYANQSESDLVFPNYDSEEILGVVKKPTTTEFGKHEKSYYPSYLNPLTKMTDSQKQEILAENQEIILETPSKVQSGELQKHVSADGQFFATVSDETPRIIKKININHVAQRRHSLGLFAPAGEILTVTIDESLVNSGLTIIVGYPYVENNISNIGAMVSNRMPNLYVDFKLTKTVTKIGSPFGGMVILDSPGGVSKDFSITISGGVDSPDYKLGVTTKEEWKDILKTPGFVWLISPYIYHVVPKAFLQNIDDPYNALLLWHKAASMSLYTIGRENFNTPIVHVYDSYVPSGGAVAFVWAFFSILPCDWGVSAMNYQSLMNSGNWGSFHEFNHHNQAMSYSSNQWGVGENGEVTNNVLNALSYILFTDIATNRTDEAGSLRDWNVCCDPYQNYEKLLLENSKVDNFEALGTNKLFAYIDLVHNFGAEKFCKFVRAMYGLDYPNENSLAKNSILKNQDEFTIFASKFFGKDFTSYFKKVWKFNLSESTISQVRALNLEEFFSLTNVYSVGLKGVETGREYAVNYGIDNVLDLEGKTLCSADFFILKKVGKPHNGVLTKRQDGKYIYRCNPGAKEDSFDLEYTVTLNSKKFTCVLPVKLVFNANYVKATTYTIDKNNYSIFDAVKNIDLQNKTSEKTLQNVTNSVENGVNITHFETQVRFSEDKDLTFMVYGDDKTLLEIGEKQAYTNNYIGDLQTAINQNGNKIQLHVQKNIPILIEAYCYNVGGIGKMNLLVSEDGVTYSNIANQNFYATYVSENDIEALQRDVNIYPFAFNLSQNYFKLFYANKINISRHIQNIKVQTSDGQEVLTTPESRLENMFDGSLNTHYHTAWRGKITPFPHEYIIEFDQPQLFDQMKIYFWNNAGEGGYAMGDFQLLISQDGQEFDLILEDKNSKTVCVLDLEKTYKAKYVKLVIKSSAKQKNFTCVSEIELWQNTNYENFNVTASDSNSIVYQGDWKSQSGNFLNGKAAKSFSGTATFVLNGTDLTVYSLNENSKIYIDDQEYIINKNEQSYAPSFIISDLSPQNHVVKIVANDMTLNGLATSGRIFSINDLGSGILSLPVIIVLSVLLFLILSACSVTLCNVVLKRRKK